ERPLEVAVVAQLEAGAARQAGFPGPLVGNTVLLLRQRHAEDLRLDLPGEIEAEAAPAAADVENGKTGRLQPHLRGDVALLRLLRLVERRVRSLEIGTGILHVLVEEEPVELA